MYISRLPEARIGSEPSEDEASLDSIISLHCRRDLRRGTISFLPLPLRYYFLF